MTSPHDTDPRARAREALERLWCLGQRLAAARRDLRGMLPIKLEHAAPPDEGATLPREVVLSELDQVLVDAFLFRLGAAVTGLIEDTMEPLLLAEQNLFFFIGDSDNLRELQSCGAIASADEVLAIRERVGQHYLITTFEPAERAEALNAAWADGESMIHLLVGLSRHLLEREPVPDLQPFVPDPP